MNEKLKEILNKVLDNNSLPQVVSLNQEDNLQDQLGLDSLMLAELTVRLEDEFDVDIFENGMVHTVGDIISLLTPSNSGA